MLEKLPASRDPNLLTGFSTSDDAGVYRLDDDRALVVTADFITPPVDDPYVFGQIAAANALSDVYAMGGKPLTCLNLVCFPLDKLGAEVLEGMIEGAIERIHAAGAVLAGGHSVDDEEPKFGLSVTGLVHPERYWSNAGAREGDQLILTKPIGSGVLFNANLKRKVSEKALKECIATLISLNDKAADVLSSFDVHAATDVSGFGLCGHALEMAKASGLELEIDSGSVPLFDEALLMYDQGFTTGANATNRDTAVQGAHFACTLSTSLSELMVDPQTSGGLLVALPAIQSKRAVDVLHDAGMVDAAIIGGVNPRNDDKFVSIK